MLRRSHTAYTFMLDNGAVDIGYGLKTQGHKHEHIRCYFLYTVKKMNIVVICIVDGCCAKSP